ncbi:primosomal protein N' [Flavobacterium branchiophilum]|uniref:Replication restart protein PriA n=1 Tax=Flavobacterium branchiophilum (strain FL-15) TaxID=1034807 RepID=G2Z195_FLABF|nr:primosomal protein N' [Flavobacterium branchiophilum]CCB69658.1 Primosomal protein N' [Flavobacterium branchiophilum FL-15]
MYFIDVIIALSLPKTFTYQINEHEFHFIQIGMRVVVPFGKSKLYTAIVVKIHQNEPLLYQAKEIDQILDEKPIVTPIQIQHWFWISDYYMCNIGEVLKAALPSALLLESETTIECDTSNFIDEKTLNDEEFLIYEALKIQNALKISDIIKILNRKNVFPIIQKLIQKKVILLHEEVTEVYKPKLVKYIQLNPIYQEENGLNLLLNELKKSEKQRNLVMHYFQMVAKEKNPLAVKNLLDAAASNTTILKSLIQKNIFEIYYIQENRIQFDGKATSKDLILNEYQQQAFQDILLQLQTKNVCLLHGVTASGKTEVYIKIIEKYLINNKQVLYLLPEIALTTQLVQRLRKHFGNKVAVYHSKFNINERVEVWHQVLNQADTAQIVIGVRSSMFLPFQNLGFIIIDEEHEQTFKQIDPAPRYHARDASIVLANLHQAKVLLGSATPSLETYFNTQNQKYGITHISKRYGNVKMPNIELVDLKDKYYRKKMTGHFSDVLLDEINTALSLQQQVILLQNRRGFSPILECITCGHIPGCSQCDVSLTYHKSKNQLRCHYCGYAIAKPITCHVCSSPHLDTKGFGTEQIQQELVELYPSSKIGRMDQDTTRGKFGFEKIIDSFKNKEFDILVGTQMLAKGLDFDNVSLVGVMNADNLLYYPDFRALERSYQLLAQVAGRSGRSENQGKVIVQTYNPLHHTLQQMVLNDYISMYNEQIYERKIYHYPPFYKLIKISLRHRDYEKLNHASVWLVQALTQNLNIPILGPEEPAISRIRNEYIKNILVKIPQNSALAQTKKTIQKILNSFENVAPYKSIRIVLTVDFY